ncbi:MAG: ABC transporter ATP-binding protein [Microthrixaceae bacterium]
MSLLEVEGVSISYSSGATAVRGVSLEVPEGGRIAVIGPNGAGKTSLTRLLTGALRPYRGRLTGGSVRFGGQDLTKMSSGQLIRAGISHVPEGRGVIPTLTVEDNVRMVLAAIPRRRRPTLDQALGIYPVLIERRKTTAGLLSGGQQQMLAIARALATKPRLLIADELSLGLAPMTVRDLVDDLHRRSVDDGTAVVLVEQSALTALRFSQYTYLLDMGLIVHQEDSSTLLASGAAHKFFVGGGHEVQREDSHDS